MNSAPSGGPSSSEKRTLTDALRLRFRFIIEPVVARLARLPISPNLLTVLGTLGHLIVAWLIINGQMQAAGIVILFIAPLDALDGALARKLGRNTRGFGAFLDSTLDRIAEIIMFAGFLFYYGSIEETLMVATTYIAITGSLMVSYARARAEALGLSCKIGILSRVERYAILTLTLLVGYPAIGLVIVATFSYITVAQRVFHVWQQTIQE
jgi:CDP-diacylglycerol--glycerol-3-phosphate 3-phosphatidyltransferase